MVRLPFASAAAVARGAIAEPHEVVDVFLALRDQDRSAQLLLKDVRQPVQHPLHALQIPYPAAEHVGPALPEILRRESHHLIKQRAVLAEIVVRLIDDEASVVTAVQELLAPQPLNRTVLVDAELMHDELHDAATLAG